MQRTNAKAKIVITVVVLLSTLALVALGTFAWFTLSTKGEMQGIVIAMERTGDEWPFEFIEYRDDDTWATIGEILDAASRSEGDGWQKCVTLGMVHYIDEDGLLASKSADDCYQLRPISTSDLTNWYLPYYNGLGEVDHLGYATFSAVANINRYNPTASQTGDDIPSNYLYYYDLWVRTLSTKHSYDLHLSNPLEGEDADGSKYEEYDYGTFVLPGLVNNNGTVEENKAGYDMSRCLRIGFEVFDNKDPWDVTNEERVGFWIYEPNCDSRAQYFTQFKDPKTQAPMYQYEKSFTYVLGNNAEQTYKVESQSTRSELQDYQTLLPHAKDENTLEFININDITIKQLKSEWDKDRITPSIASQKHVDSTYIKTFGKFIKSDGGPERSGYEGIDTPIFATVIKDKPVHIRVYVWMEGQDVDCWNSSLAGSLRIGLEFRGDVADTY